MRPTTAIIFLCALPMGTLPVSLLGCDSSSADTAKTASDNAVDKLAVTAPADGRVTVDVSEYGYAPATIAATAGKPLTLLFRRTSDKGCGGEVVFPERGIHKALPVGETVEVAFTPETSGRIAFTCGMGMYEGAIIVSEGG